MKTLYERLKPNIKDGLVSNEKRFKLTVSNIYKTLKETYRYGELTIDTIQSIYVFSNTSSYDIDSFDWKWGDNLFYDAK